MRSSGGAHTPGAFYFGNNPMRECNEYVARVALCEQTAKDARTESEKQTWLVMADSWREMLKLQETLKRQAEFIRKVPMPAYLRGLVMPIDTIITDRLVTCESLRGIY
jgi:hypothetical protein